MTNKKLLPAALTVIDDSEYVMNEKGEHVKQPPKVYTYPFPQSEDDISRLIAQAESALEVARKTGRNVGQEIREVLKELETDLEKSKSDSLIKCFAKQPDSQFAISFQVNASGGADSPAYFFMPECEKYTILYPARGAKFLERHRANGYTSYSHELAHFFDDNRTGEGGHLHSSSALFRACFDIDKKLFPAGLAVRAFHISEESGYCRGHETFDVLYREYFANSLALMISGSVASDAGSPLQKYMELVLWQADGFDNAINAEAVVAVIKDIQTRLEAQANLADAALKKRGDSAAIKVMRLVDTVRKPVKRPFWTL